MQKLETINKIITSDSITLYWDKPEKCEKGLTYQVFVNGEVLGETDKTHYEIENLFPEMKYVVQIIGNVESKHEIEGQKALEGIIIEKVLESEVLDLETTKAKKLLDVTKAPYYAVGDGQTLNTKALQQAFDDCKPDEVVYLPEGVFMTGALRMHSHMELYLDEGAVLQGTDCVTDYLPKIKSRFEGIENESYSSLLNLGNLDHDGDYNCRNVVIRGKGTIASGGSTMAKRVIELEKELLKDYLTSLGDKIGECEKPETIPGRVRPRLINMSNCQNIVLSGVSLKNGASWNVHMIYSDQIVTNNCTFYSEHVWNGDGWDPDSSTNCTLFGCTFYTGDDSVAIKSGKNPEGNVIKRPTEHIRIFDCKCAFGNGIAIGSEMSGGINDVRIWDCDMSNSVYGIEIKGTKKRGGYVRNIQVIDSKVSRILFHSVGYNDDGIGAPVAPVFENCSFERMQITGRNYNHKREWNDCEVIELCGFDEPGHEIKNILFRDIVLGEQGRKKMHSLSLGFCENITLERFRTLQ